MFKPLVSTIYPVNLSSKLSKIKNNNNNNNKSG